MKKLSREDLDRAVSSAARVMLACDFDGTLCRIAVRPELVYLPEGTREALRTVSALPNTTVAILSGRTLEDVESRVGLPLIYSGNHGFEIRGPGIEFEHPEAIRHVGLLSRVCDALEHAVAGWNGAWVERKRLTATVHFRNVAADEQHRVAMTVRRIVACHGAVFSLRAGKRALEVRPRVEWHKGAAVDHILKEIGYEDALCICVGDDVTDETMFRAFPDHLTIRVGWHAGSAARYYVDDPTEVRTVLERLAEISCFVGAAEGWAGQNSSLIAT